MKIAVTSTGPKLDDAVDARFGRCPYFLIVELETLETESIQNPNISLGGGVGVQSAQLMSKKGVSVVLTGNCGPNAFRTFGAAGIEMITGISGCVREAVEQFKAGKLSYSSAASAQSHFGIGQGTGRGQAIVGGFSRSLDPETAIEIEDSFTREKMEDLKNIATDLRSQIESIEARIRDLENS